MAEIVSKAAFARELGVSRPRITQLCQEGLPVTPDGRVNRRQALKWLAENVDPARGGWPRKNANAQDVDTRKEPAPKMLRLDESPDYQLLPDYMRGAVGIVNALRRPGNIRCIAEMVIAHGCTAAQAYGVAQMYGFLLALWMHDAVADFLGQEHARVIYLFETEPDWSEIARIAGEPLDMQAWEKESKRCVDEWTARAEIERSKPLR